MEGSSGEGEAPRQRRGPAPIASFDHDGSDESSPESKLAFRLPEIREHPAGLASGAPGANEWLSAPGEGRARSHSTPAVGALPAPAPRIDISRASSSSHHDSRDSSPELALFAGDTSDAKAQRLELGFREDGALDLRSSTEELSFMEPAPGDRPVLNPPIPAPEPPSIVPPPVPPPDRRHSRKDSQSSEAALLGVSGRTSRLSSVGSACSAQSAISRVSRLSVVSGVSRSPSPHRMLLETSFCGPKPIETDPEACAAAVAEHILEIAKMSSAGVASPPTSPPDPLPSATATAVDARDHREIRTEVTVEAERPAAPTPNAMARRDTPQPELALSPVTVEAEQPAAPTPNAMARRETRQPALALSPVMTTPKAPEPEKTEKASKKARNEERKARPRVRREPSEPEVYKSRNKSKDIIRIKLRPDDEEEEEEEETARKPVSLELTSNSNPAHGPPSPAPSRRRSPSPLGPPTVSRKSSFCSLFKSRETIGSPDSPQAQEALRRKRSLTEGRSRSKSRDRSATPTSTKIRGSVLSLFRTPRKSVASSSPGSRATSPAPQPMLFVTTATVPVAQQDKLKYYEDTKNGIIHIPLRTPPEDRGSGRRNSGAEAGPSGVIPSVAVSVASSEVTRPTSAPQARESKPAGTAASVPIRKPPPIVRTVLPDGSIIIPLHSPTERVTETVFPEPKDPTPPEPPRPVSRRDDIDTIPSRVESVATSLSSTSLEAVVPRELRPKEPTPTATPIASPPEQPQPDVTSKRRKERLVFTTNVGSREQVFSTQFSITKTPSVTSEISGSFPSFDNGELRDTHITSDPAPVVELPVAGGSGSGSLTAASGSGAVTPQDPPRDSSGSEPSSEAAAPQAGNDVERRGLVVQESFEDELPYVPTTLPQERSVAVPMIPVRDRGGVLVQGVQRPRAIVTTSTRAPPPTPPPIMPTPTDKLKIKLPRRPRVSSASSAPRPTKERTRSGGDSGSESRTKQEWIDFEEVPERRKQPKRIQTLPVGAADSSGVVFSYVEPEHCRCECHAHAHAPADDQLPLLQDDMQNSRISTSSAECGEEETAGAPRPPFNTDLDVRDPAHTEPQSTDQRP